MSSFLQAGRPPVILASASKSRARILRSGGSRFHRRAAGPRRGRHAPSYRWGAVSRPSRCRRSPGTGQGRGGQRSCPQGLRDRRRSGSGSRRDDPRQARQHGGGAWPAARSPRQAAHASHRGRRRHQWPNHLGGDDAGNAYHAKTVAGVHRPLPCRRRRGGAELGQCMPDGSRSAFNCSKRSRATISRSWASPSYRSSIRFGARASSKGRAHAARLCHRLAGRAFPLAADPSLLAEAVRHRRRL